MPKHTTCLGILARELTVIASFAIETSGGELYRSRLEVSHWRTGNESGADIGRMKDALEAAATVKAAKRARCCHRLVSPSQRKERHRHRQGQKRDDNRGCPPITSGWLWWTQRRAQSDHGLSQAKTGSSAGHRLMSPAKASADPYRYEGSSAMARRQIASRAFGSPGLISRGAGDSPCWTSWRTWLTSPLNGRQFVSTT
jgi:hypothetical protein